MLLTLPPKGSKEWDEMEALIIATVYGSRDAARLTYGDRRTIRRRAKRAALKIADVMGIKCPPLGDFTPTCEN